MSLGVGLDETPTAEPSDERVELVGLFRVASAVDPSGQSQRTTTPSDGTNASG